MTTLPSDLAVPPQIKPPIPHTCPFCNYQFDILSFAVYDSCNNCFAHVQMLKNFGVMSTYKGFKPNNTIITVNYKDKFVSISFFMKEDNKVTHFQDPKEIQPILNKLMLFL